MGGAVSSGRDNNELIDNLMGGNYIRTPEVERVFRALDRAEYMTPNARDQAYKDLAWRYGHLHMSAPCIYSEVMEGLELRPGLSFLNIGSGTGYLSTLVGLLLGSGGINHGVEVHSMVVDYANTKLSQFFENSPVLDEFDFCEPKFYCGNGLCLAPLPAPYDRVYCGAGCPEEYQNYFKQLIKVGGILVMPLNDSLLQLKRVSSDEWESRNLLNVSFATLRVPTKEETEELIRLESQAPPRLQALARGAVRGCLRAGVLRRHPELRAPPPPAPRAKPPRAPRRICIPVEDDGEVEGLNALHDLPRDRGSGASEMNALLSLVLSMGQNRVAGAIRFDPSDSPSDSSSDEENEPTDTDAADETADTNDAEDRPVDLSALTVNRSLMRSMDRQNNDSRRAIEVLYSRPDRGVISFEVRDSNRASSREQSNENSRDGKETLTTTEDNAKPGTSTETSSQDSGIEKTDGKDDSSSQSDKPKMDDRSKKSGAKSDADDDDAKPDDDGDAVPAEVEICLGKQSTSQEEVEMDWDKITEAETETTERKKKRQKFDSGIGEENSPSTASSRTRESEMSDTSNRSETLESDDVEDDLADLFRDRKRQAKRARRSVGGESSSSTDENDFSEAALQRRQARRLAESAGARRVRLSLCMKRGVKELPLPMALKKYVNLGRCFQI